MKHPLVKKLTYLKIDELGKSTKFEIVSGVINDAIESGYLSKKSKKEMDFLHGLINLGWDLDKLKKEGHIINNGKKGDKCIWSINK